MWIVTLIKKPVKDDFRTDYFPRKFHYQEDAIKLANEVAKKGGEARVERSSK